MKAMDTPISFVIPAYNEEHYLGGCLDAILREAKGRTGVEIIVVDNNSNDGTAAVAKARPGVTLLREPRRGANRTRQTGFEAAHGELIAFLDADTIMPPGWIDRVERAFAKDPNLVCLSGPFIYYDLPMRIRALSRTFYLIAYVIYLAERAILKKTTIVQGGNYAVRAEAFRKIGGQNVDLTFYGDDTDNAVRLSKVGFVKFDLSLTMPTSGRRLAKEGVFVMGLRYTINNIWIIFFHRPYTEVSTEVRFGKEGTVYRPTHRVKDWFIGIGAFIILAAIAAVILAALWFGIAALAGIFVR